MKVANYHCGISPYNKDPIKSDLLRHYITGVNVSGDVGIDNHKKDIIDSDVGVLQGWISDKQDKPHLRFRKNVIDYYTSNSKYIVTADASLFNYKSKQYLRYSFNGVFPNTGIYCDNIIDKSRWDKISASTGIKILKQRTQGSHILLLLQRQGGWSLGNLDVTKWTEDTIKSIRKYSDREIIIRPHPNDWQIKHYKSTLTSFIKKYKYIKLCQSSNLQTDLENAWAIVNHNSSSVVGPIIQGHYCFITDPEKSQCKEVSNTSFSKIENPDNFDRERWLQRISMFHWNFEELKDGSCWKHMRQYIT